MVIVKFLKIKIDKQFPVIKFLNKDSKEDSGWQVGWKKANLDQTKEGYYEQRRWLFRNGNLYAFKLDLI